MPVPSTLPSECEHRTPRPPTTLLLSSSAPLFTSPHLSSRPDGSELDVREGHARIRMLSHDIARQAAGGIAGTPYNTWARASRGEGAVEPQHARHIIGPERHDQDHATAERITHLGEAALPGEVVVVAKHGLLLGAELAVDAVGLVDACNV